MMTNNGGGLPKAGEIGGVRANAAAAKFSRVVAARVYGDSARPRGYIYGASGGAYQTIGALENSEGVWDGGVPMVPGTPNAIPSSMAVQLLGLRVLRDELPRIVDAMEPGGSGDPYAGLTEERRAVLQEVTRQGFPLRGWWDWENLTGGAFFAVGGGVRILDASYVDDFWTKPGYAGTDPASSVGDARIQFETEVTELVGSQARGLKLADRPAGDLDGADIVILTGAAAGKTITFARANGDEIVFPADVDAAVTGALKPGDRVRLDNSWFLALQYYQRHQVPSADQYGWNQFRDANGAPRYPQRPMLAGPTFAQAASGAVPTGRFHGKMIMLGSLLDVEAFPWPADWYREQARSTLGGQFDDRYRLWYLDNAGHGSPRDAAAGTHVVDYAGAAQQALLDLDAWVVDGTAPPASTAYTVDDDSQVHPADTAEQRGGVQAVVALTIDKVGSRDTGAAARADAPVGQPVTLSARAELPPGAGEIVRVEWDFDGAGTFPESSPVADPDRAARATITHTFTKPGTYYPVVRVTSRRDGDPEQPYGLVQNLARVRVVVG
ncbi:PKD domain-containing protein [Frankia sp. CNm7]|uniref:PKD domain-containing protein n=1 Tax=Frankia nepalensis TaxID=1836974 RepID=A0A937RP64_9ACTN|nr:PKD domain-containing protein [Frankia nepalensis]MBL7515700.1 PKD domain-containing protein [Frankia nepalensis]MBL7519725.1 PKD domain-containing protein [Frankia nepalensis]MBL7632455.1 PKD domain-containing protein [Frankia nepalensis]